MREHTEHKKTDISLNIVLYFVLLNQFRKSNSSTAVRKNILFSFVIGSFIAVGSHEWTTLVPSMDRKHNIRLYTQ